MFDKATYDKFVKEVPSYKLITPSVVSERLKIRGSLARAGLKELVTKGLFFLLLLLYSSNSNLCIYVYKGLIRVISRHHSQEIYTKIQKDEPEGEKAEKAEEAAVKQPKGQKGKKAKAEAAAVEADE